MKLLLRSSRGTSAGLRAATLALLLGGVGQAPAAVLGKDRPSTVGSTTESNGLQLNGRFVVRTPSILRVGGEQKVPPNPGAALAQYDRLLALPAEPAIRADALRRAADLRVQLAEVDGQINAPVLRKAISLYQTLLAEQPDHPLNDRVLYQLARAQQAVGDSELAIASLLQLGRRYPSSLRAPDGLFRAAELLFQRKRYAEAEPAYRQVLASGPATPYFEPAQFKYGWTLVRQAKHEEALTVFYAILERELPPGVLADPKAALAAIKPGKLDVATEVLRVTGLSLAALGGGRGVSDSFDRAGAEPRFATLLYVSLAEQLQAQQRYTDAAEASLAFVERHPRHPLAPAFESRALAAWEQGGFNELLIAGKARYVEHYLPGAAYWQGATPTAEVMTALKGNLAALGRHYHATAQARPETEIAARQADFLKAADWYARSLQLFPNDPAAAELALLQADALYDGGRYEAAARQYERAAYDYRSGGQPTTAPASAYAAVQAWQRLARDGAAEARPAALKESVRASLKLAEQFPAHPHWALTLTRAAGDLLALNDPEAAFGVATRVLAAQPPAAPELRREMLGVVADARYSQQNYAAAETAYAELLKLLSADDAQRAPAAERLARSVYEQAVLARTAGDLKTAARAFQRVGAVVPDAAIRPAADFDAASAYFELRDWANAEASLEAFRQRFPAHALAIDAEKKLASAYDKDNKPGRAAGVYAAIAQRDGLPAETRRNAQWLAGEGYRRAGEAGSAARMFELYVAAWPQPQDRAQEARHQLAELARTASRDPARHRYWLQEIVKADGASPVADTASPARLLAAQANLELGQAGAAQARQLRLSLPLETSLAQRRAALEGAVQLLDRAASYGYAEVTTAATHELATVYREFGRAIVESDRPASLSGEALAQYTLLLEEQANGFDEKAMQAYEANLARLREGVWNEWVRRSTVALSELAPARYGKNVRLEDRYESMH